MKIIPILLILTFLSACYSPPPQMRHGGGMMMSHRPCSQEHFDGGFGHQQMHRVTGGVIVAHTVRYYRGSSGSRCSPGRTSAPYPHPSYQMMVPQSMSYGQNYGGYNSRYQHSYHRQYGSYGNRYCR